MTSVFLILVVSPKAVADFEKRSRIDCNSSWECETKAESSTNNSSLMQASRVWCVISDRPS